MLFLKMQTPDYEERIRRFQTEILIELICPSYIHATGKYIYGQELLRRLLIAGGLVLSRGLEPLRVSPQVPKTCAYTNSATRAQRILYQEDGHTKTAGSPRFLLVYSSKAKCSVFCGLKESISSIKWFTLYDQ